MSAPLRRAARREREAAKLLGTTRVHRGRYESAPDVRRVQLPSGHWATVEVKTRGKAPALVRAAMKQAKGYGEPGDIAIAVVSATGAAALAFLELRDLSALLGIVLPEEAAASVAGRAKERSAHGQQTLQLEMDPRPTPRRRRRVP